MITLSKIYQIVTVRKNCYLPWGIEVRDKAMLTDNLNALRKEMPCTPFQIATTHVYIESEDDTPPAKV